MQRSEDKWETKKKRKFTESRESQMTFSHSRI